MRSRVAHFLTIAITAFIPWFIVLAAMGATSDFSGLFFLMLHYALVVLLFGIAFAMYFRGHPGEQPFTVMVSALISLFVFEFVFVRFVSYGGGVSLTYLDWIVPLFLIAATVYGTGKLFK